MTVTVTDMFCGAGGSSLGAEAAGLELVMAANHWSTAIDVHQAHFPDAAHDCADITQVDPRRWPRTDILIASPECTNHSQARGVTRKAQQPSLFEGPDPAAERSRATMWDVVRFAEQMRYDAIVVENVVEVTKWVLYPAWCQALDDLGYTRHILSLNAMHFEVAQSRDRVFIVAVRDGIRPDLELELRANCPQCDTVTACRQAWKNGRTVGRYRQQWEWRCTSCHTRVEPAWTPASTIIDWSLPCPRIGDRTRPLAPKTRARILAGLQRHGWAPIVTAGAGNTYETTPGNRARPLTEPLPTQQTTATHALAEPPGFLFQTAHGGRIHDLEDPHPTVCASDDRLSLVLNNNFENTPTTPSEPLSTVTTGNRHGLVVAMRGTSKHHLEGSTHPTSDPLGTVAASGNHHGLLMRNNSGLGEMITPVTEPARTVTTAGHQSLLMPNTGNARTVDQPTPTATTCTDTALIDPETIVDNCGFRMLEPYEIAAAQAFPTGYIPRDLTKRDQVKLAGNAVPAPVMTWITGRILQALEQTP